MRVLITGASGSGTTTLGESVSAKMGWNVIDVDDYFWLPTQPLYQAKRDHASRLEMILEKLNEHESSVVAGSIMKWGVELEDTVDLIVFLTLVTSIRIERLVAREKKEFGAVDPEFLQWAAEYDSGPSEGRSLAKHQTWLSERQCRILNLEGNLSV